MLIGQGKVVVVADVIFRLQFSHRGIISTLATRNGVGIVVTTASPIASGGGGDGGAVRVAVDAGIVGVVRSLLRRYTLKIMNESGLGTSNLTILFAF